MPSTKHILSPLSLALATLVIAPTAVANNSANLGKTVVTASGFEQQIKDAPASISVLTQEELAKKSYRDVTDALKDVPGVVVTGGGSSSDISIRGMAGKYTLILVDGRRQDSRATRPNSDNAGIEQGWLPPIEAIDRIEVVRGPMSSLYGSDAMGGVINIITKKTNQAWHGSIRTEKTFQNHSNSGDYNKTDVFLSGPLVNDILGVQLYGQKSHREEDRFTDGYNQQKLESGTAKFLLTPNENHDVSLEFGSSEQNRKSHTGKSAANSGPSDNTYKRRYFALTHTGRWENGVIDSYIQREKNDNTDRKMYTTNTVFNTQGSLFLGAHTLTAGAQYKKEELEDGSNLGTTLDKKIDRWAWAIFAEDEWGMTDTFSLTSGVRLDRDENFGSHWSPRIYGVWNPLEQWTFKGGISSGYRSPDLRQAIDGWGHPTGKGSAVIWGNSNLKPEKSVTAELGFVWDNLDNLTAGLTIYQTNFKDKITEVNICDSKNGDTCAVNPSSPNSNSTYSFESTNINVGKVDMKGLEATFDWQIIEHLKLAANYTFTDTEQKSGKFKGKPLNKMPRHMFNTTLDWTATDQLNTWVRVNYRGKDSEYLHRGKSIREQTPAHTFLDLGANYKISENFSVMGGIYNLGNKRLNTEKYERVLDGRRYQIGATVTF
ncbi:ligand-gated channel protein [Pseudomonas sp. F1_0610]|uniref:ligand-gated channel protein n=1 Tax=Pseudomonas sp. F1_0610 TaxID=3114284 RepID=UPI0039C120C8